MLSKLYSFEDFLFEKLDTVSFVLSDELNSVLETISDPIAKRLRQNSATGKQKKITLIDVVQGDYNKWSFINAPKVIQFLDEHSLLHGKLAIKNYTKELQKHKSETRIGRIINKLYPNEYTPVDIEKFVNEYKKYFSTKFELIDIVKGEDINKWYNCNNYNNTGESTSLTNSCMRQDYKNKYMDLYAINDDKVSMVIMYSDKDKDKIDARSILWKPDLINGKDNTNGDLVMDRIYYNKEENKNTLQKFAENKGWYYKVENDSSINGKFYNPHTKQKDERPIFKIENIKIPEHRMFPFADTLAVFDPETNELSNDESLKKTGYLSSTGGDVDGLVWIDSKKRFYHPVDLIKVYGFNDDKNKSGYYLKDDAVYLDFYDKYFLKDYIKNHELVKVKRLVPTQIEENIFKDDAVYAEDEDKYYYKDDVRYSDFLDIYIPRNTSVYVPSMDSYMPKEDLVKVITSIYNDGSIRDLEYYHVDDPREPYFKYIDGEYYINELKDKLKEIENEKS